MNVCCYVAHPADGRETNESTGDFPTLPPRQSEAALHHRHSQYAPRTEL